jgi:hypothetical protein
METGGVPRRRRSPIGGLILILIGVFFLVVTLRPDFNPWPVFAHYWPVILIVIGLGKIWDVYANRQGGEPAIRHSGAFAALVILVMLFGLALWKGSGEATHLVTDTQTVELQGAKTVSADLEMPAGTLTLSGGSAKLLDANFRYRNSEGKPQVDYSVSGDHGQLSITQNEKHIHVGTTHSDWNLRFANNVPLDLNLQMGAGHSDLQLRELDVTHLEVKIGAGEMQLDLSGPRKSSLDADIQGGVGSATIYLPKDVGVRVHASGGIGSVNTHGMTKDDDDYVNSVYGKTPATITLTIQGGVGSIDLEQR